MQIIGEKYLIDDSYRTIYIGKTIKVQGDDRLTLFEDNPLVKELENLSDEEQVSRIIDYFINSNSVGGVIYGCSEDGHERNIIVTTDDKPLVIDLPITKLDSVKIMNKYKKDRTEALNRSGYTQYTLSSKFESSSVYKVENNEIEFSMPHKNARLEIYYSEIEFIKELIETLFQGEIIGISNCYEKIGNKDVFIGFYMESKNSGTKVKLKNLIYYNDILVAIINNHNCEVNQNRKENMNRQLKMEGF